MAGEWRGCDAEERRGVKDESRGDKCLKREVKKKRQRGREGV